MDDTREWLIELLKTTEIDEFGGRKLKAGDLYLPLHSRRSARSEVRE